jgi:hypothetical protein
VADNHLPEEAVWENGIRQIETTDVVIGGVDGVPNIAPKQLANRTSFLKKKAEDHEGHENPHPQYASKSSVDDLLAEKTISVDNLYYARDEKPSGTTSGNTLAGQFNVRDINTEVVSNIPGVLLANNQVSLPKGNYWIEALAPVFAVRHHRLHLYNVTDGEYPLKGQSGFAQNSGSAQLAVASLFGYLSIQEDKIIELRHYTDQAVAGGFGMLSDDGSPEVFAELKIWRVGNE